MEFASNRPCGLMTPTTIAVGVVLFEPRHRLEALARGVNKMATLLLVGAGGFLGSVLRYAIGGLLVRLGSGNSFPHETLVINSLGCFLIGALAHLSEVHGGVGSAARSFLLIGLLGGFTTFSTFGYETFQLLRDRQVTVAMTSAALQILLGVGGVWAGVVAARSIWGR
jgi:fluoride exporter